MTPLLAFLDFTDFLIYFLFFMYLIFGGCDLASQRANLRRLERKLDALLEQQGVTLPPVVSKEVKRILLRDATKKSEAIKLHAGQAKLSEEDATADVEAYLEGKD